MDFENKLNGRGHMISFRDKHGGADEEVRADEAWVKARYGRKRCANCRHVPSSGIGWCGQYGVTIHRADAVACPDYKRKVKTRAN